MSVTGIPTNINLNDTNPPAPPDAINIDFQVGASTIDPSDPTKLLRDTSGFYYPPQVGGVLLITEDYELGGPDSGWTFVCDSATPFTISMPPSPPVLQNGQGIWRVRIVNLGVGAVTLNLNGLTLDITSSSPLSNPVLQQGQALDISTDGSNLFSGLKASGWIGGVDERSSTSETVSLSSQQKLVTLSNGSAVAVALDSTLGAAFMCWVLNLGAGTATLTPSAIGSPPASPTINGAATLALTTGQGAALFFDGTQWFAEVGAGTGGGGGSGTVTHTGALTVHDVVVGNGTDDIKVIGSGTSGQFLKSAGSSADPAFASIVESDVASLVSDLATLASAITSEASTRAAADALKAPLASPALTGTPTAPTAAGATNTTQIATTAFVEGEISGLATKAGVQAESYTYAADSGSVNAYAVTLSPVPTLAAGSKVVFKAANANTGASTLAVNGGSAKNIFKKTNSNLVSGDILANQIIEVVYDGTNFQLTGNGASGSSPLVIGFAINNGAAGTDVGPMLLAPRAGTISRCQIVTKASDGTTGLTFLIKKNGVNVFSSNPTVAAATASGTTSSSTSLTSSPLPVAFNDIFTIDILSGSPNWLFTAQLET